MTLVLALLLADAFSPGPLSKAHQNLEGLSNCTKCHVQGGKLGEQQCLACHKELAPRIASHEGFHGKLADNERRCEKCHHEHRGRDFALVNFGNGGKKGFDHARTGFTLLGKHLALDCAKCHVKEKTMLGAQTSCAACHFDEHRGQLGADCKACHDEKSFKPAPGFSHARAAFPLQGKHAGVECLKCHAREQSQEKGHEVFSRFKPVQHAGCIDCHKDPHDGRLGNSCEKCHVVEGWQLVKTAESAGSGERAFHEKTRYPLRGAHVDAACKGCHGEKPAVYKNLRFETCNACHADAHFAQLSGDCSACHTVNGFRPARYELADHRRWPLQGAHGAVACLLCHPRELSLARAAQRPLRKTLVSLSRFHTPGDTQRCETCHEDAHQGQLKPKACAECHAVEGFAPARFDHAKARFPLEGAHAQAACALCHTAVKGVVRYRPLETACASCHADQHAGQFAEACTACHTAAAWKPVSFEHAKVFPLEGKHAQAECAACHRAVEAGGVKIARYRGVPRTCEGCHVDVHQGAFQGVTP